MKLKTIYIFKQSTTNCSFSHIYLTANVPIKVTKEDLDNARRDVIKALQVKKVVNL